MFYMVETIPFKYIRFKLTVPEWQSARRAAIAANERWFLRWVRKTIVKAASESEQK